VGAAVHLARDRFLRRAQRCHLRRSIRPWLYINLTPTRLVTTPEFDSDGARADHFETGLFRFYPPADQIAAGIYSERAE
jgi:hypothetical protein